MQSYRIEGGKLVETWLSVLALGMASGSSRLRLAEPSAHGRSILHEHRAVLKKRFFDAIKDRGNPASFQEVLDLIDSPLRTSHDFDSETAHRRFTVHLGPVGLLGAVQGGQGG